MLHTTLCPYSSTLAMRSGHLLDGAVPSNPLPPGTMRAAVCVDMSVGELSFFLLKRRGQFYFPPQIVASLLLASMLQPSLVVAPGTWALWLQIHTSGDTVVTALCPSSSTLLEVVIAVVNLWGVSCVFRNTTNMRELQWIGWCTLPKAYMHIVP